MIVGLWFILSPWLLGFHEVTLVKWANVLVGILLVLLNAWVIFGEKMDSTHSTGSGQASSFDSTQDKSSLAE